MTDLGIPWNQKESPTTHSHGNDLHTATYKEYRFHFFESLSGKAEKHGKDSWLKNTHIHNF